MRGTNFHSIVRLLNIASIKCNVRVAIKMCIRLYITILAFESTAAAAVIAIIVVVFFFSQPGGGTLKVHLYFKFHCSTHEAKQHSQNLMIINCGKRDPR